jgi:hypothetical protein
MFVSIVGQASFQTAERRGPSTMERSYRRDGGGGVSGLPATFAERGGLVTGER